MNDKKLQDLEKRINAKKEEDARQKNIEVLKSALQPVITQLAKEYKQEANALLLRVQNENKQQWTKFSKQLEDGMIIKDNKLNVVGDFKHAEIPELFKQVISLSKDIKDLKSLDEIKVKGQVKLSEPVEINKLDELMTNILNEITNKIPKEIKLPLLTNIEADPTEYIPVRITNGQNWLENLSKVISGANPFIKFQNSAGQDVYVSDDNPLPVNATVTLDASDIQIGAVELKDGDSDTRLDIESDGTKNAAFVQANALPLPTGASTSANQSTANTSLSNIDTNTSGTSTNTSTIATNTNYRYSGGKTSVVSTVTSSGDTTIHTPASGKAIRLYWISALVDQDELTSPLIKIGFGSGTSIDTELYRTSAVAHWEVFESNADDKLIINLSQASNVYATAHIEEFTP